MTLKEFLKPHQEHLLDVTVLKTGESLCCGVEDYLSGIDDPDLINLSVPLSCHIQTSNQSSLIAFVMGIQFEILIPPIPEPD